jgi:hypothetical protein
MMSALITILSLLLLQFAVGMVPQNGSQMEGFIPSRTGVSPLPGPASLPTFRVIATNVQGSLKGIGYDGSSFLTDGTTVSSYTATGEARWRVPVSTHLNGSVVDLAFASSGLVYASSANALIALDPATGQPVWAQPFVANSGDESSPLIIGKDGTIYFHTGVHRDQSRRNPKVGIPR